MTKDDARQFQLERANLIDHLSAARRILGATQGFLQADKLMAAVGLVQFTPAQQELLDRITAYLNVGMFDELPQEIAR